MKYSSLVAGALFAAVAMPATAVESIYTAVLTGSAEAPPHESPATGTATVTIDTGSYTMRVQETFSGLLAENAASHIHCCTNRASYRYCRCRHHHPDIYGFSLRIVRRL